MKLGVSLYSYQQSQFFRELDLEAQVREVGKNLPGADGIEMVDEMSLRYPDPGQAFVARWFGWMERYGTVPVTMDVSFDVLQFRDHVMSHTEVTERLARDMRLAKRLGFRNVRVLSTCPFDVMVAALPLAESLDIRLGKEVASHGNHRLRRAHRHPASGNRAGFWHFRFPAHRGGPRAIRTAWGETRGLGGIERARRPVTRRNCSLRGICSL
jgi:hypothetical protein